MAPGETQSLYAHCCNAETSTLAQHSDNRPQPVTTGDFHLEEYQTALHEATWQQHWYKANWSSEPTLHIISRRTQGDKRFAAA